jgi:hypothetical protein
MQAQVDHTVAFFEYTGVRVNAAKTKLIVINESNTTTLQNLIVDKKCIFTTRSFITLQVLKTECMKKR